MFDPIHNPDDCAAYAEEVWNELDLPELIRVCNENEAANDCLHALVLEIRRHHAQEHGTNQEQFGQLLIYQGLACLAAAKYRNINQNN